jgi:enolase
MKTIIRNIHARQLLDCKCRPMVEVDVVLDNGSFGRGSAPTGSSVGFYEAFILRDHNPQEYDGMSVHTAVNNVNKIIAPALIGMDAENQAAIDGRMIELDGTENKSRLGGNAIYSTSIACFRAAASHNHKALYEYIAQKPITKISVPSFNVINGGKYPKITQPFNEFIIVPFGAETIYEAVEMGIKVFHQLPEMIKQMTGMDPEVAPSYGYAAPSEDPEVILSVLNATINKCGYENKIIFALDCASSEMYDKETQTYYWQGERISAEQLIQHTKELTNKYPFLFIEDLLDENDWTHYPLAKKELAKTNIIGDDLIATNLKRITRAYATKSIDGFILKPNQIGTITEALKTFEYAKQHNLIAIPSGRSGGVIGDIIMDLALGLDIDFIKNGAPKSGERIDKLNYLMRANDQYPAARLADIKPFIRSFAAAN